MLQQIAGLGGIRSGQVGQKLRFVFPQFWRAREIRVTPVPIEKTKQATREEFQAIFASELAGLRHPAPRPDPARAADVADTKEAPRPLTSQETVQLVELGRLRKALYPETLAAERKGSGCAA